MKWSALIWSLTLLAMGTSCQSLYIPNGPNVPLMSEGDELQAGLGVGSNGYGAQLAYSPYYHWAITANGSTFSLNSGGSFSTSQVFRHLYGEMGTGWYTRLNKYLRAEALVGYGAGNSDSIGHKSLYRKFYFQPTIGMSGPIVDFGITPRLCYISHYLDNVNDVKAKVSESGLFLEPSLTARIGYEQLKFQFQGGFAFALGDVPFTYRNSFVTMGIHLTFVKDFEKYRY